MYRRGVLDVETIGSKIEIYIEMSKDVDRKFEDIGEIGDLGGNKTMKGNEKKRNEDNCKE